MNVQNPGNYSYKAVNHFLEKISEYKTEKNINIDKNLEKKLLRMFEQTRVSFHLTMCQRGMGATNFFSYSYVLYNFFQLLDLDDLAKCVPLLKSKLKIIHMDEMWKYVCQDLRWNFISTI